MSKIDFNKAENEKSLTETPIAVMDVATLTDVEITPTQKPHYYSLNAETYEEKVMLYNALTSPEFKLTDFINKKIKMKHYLVEVISLANTETGEIQSCPRIVVIDDKGSAYHGVSNGIMGSLNQINIIFGEPSTWQNPIEVMVKQVKTKKGTANVLEIVKTTK